MQAKLKEGGLIPIFRSTIAADLIIGDDVGIICIKSRTLGESTEAFKELCQRVDLLRELFAVPLIILDHMNSNDVNVTQANHDFLYMLMAYFTLVKRVHFLQVDNEEEACKVISSLARVSL
jgi:hypothetical protein